MKHIPVTLVVYGGNRLRLTEAALTDVLSKFTFDEILLFASEELRTTLPTIVIPYRDSTWATDITWRRLAPMVKTSHVLGMQWDGYPVRPERWMNHFLDFDLIGAVWPWHATNNVGNTGFVLQSRKLLSALAKLEPRQPEDVTMCRDYRPLLEHQFHIKFAPEAIADAFSTEHGPTSSFSFGFHGLWNMLDFLPEGDLKARLRLLSPQQWRGEDVNMLASRLISSGQRSFYRWLREQAELSALAPEAMP